ncbi:helix-turn-helix domain-containing protein [Caulobacter sp. FWC2]|uniref:helix-turn-helix domain-containing protein n=1 Tax=Caulobacter sp. FWC2 TaxID=69664 RepID=UPI000C1533A7|nr:helix-turn-helix domain-containing protein [Caulobacter sp. FWC2]PIB91275.1 hypothetical protein CSW62_06615 [Caulobacter sp. FWC2]
MSPELRSFMYQKRGAGVPWHHIAVMAGKPLSLFAPYIALERGYAATKAKRDAETEEAKAKKRTKAPVPGEIFVPPPIMPALAEEIAGLYGVTVSDIMGIKRVRGISLARQHLMWVLTQDAKFSTSKVGQFLAGRDHSTVLYGAKKHAERLAGLGKGRAAA